MKEILQRIIEELVDNKDEVKIVEVESPSLLVYEISVAQNDIGKVIGRQGRNAKAIRTIIYAIARKQGKGVVIRFNDRENRKNNEIESTE